ncbi:MAG: sigma-B regulation protein RsbQ [Chloroflexota bacterium]|jgi:sigma-B regulation protein RsbQ|nr:sigma-B regulation protein RsbQ [Chloroflexota bacterium]
MNPETIDRHAVRVRGNPDGRPMLFAHGFGCDQTLWRFVAPAFEADHRVVTFDYVGAGASDRSAYDPIRYASLDGYADDILGICAALDLEDVILVAHSVSSMIAVLAAIAEPERFTDLVLVTPSPRYLDDAPAYRGGFARADIDGLLGMMDVNAMGWANYLAPVVMGNPERPELADGLEATFCSIDPVMARQFAQVTFLSDNRSDLPKVTTPSLIIQCSHDAVAPPAVGAYVHEHMAGSVLREIDATGHCPHVSHPAETVGVIQDYLTARERERLVASA